MIDLAIIGGGPAGYVAAERAGARGLSVTLFEKKSLGGVCLNEGCIPTKTLLYSAKTYDNAAAAAKYGIGAENLSFDYAKIVDRKNRVVRRLVAGIGAQMKAHNVAVVQGEAQIVGKTEEGFEISCAGQNYTAKKLLLCTGSVAAIPPIEGADGERVVTSKELLQVKERPQSLVIIGGGVIGMEFAGFFSTLGTNVTVIEMLPEILPGFDPEISKMLREYYSRKGVEFKLGCRVSRIQDEKVYYLSSEGDEGIAEGEKILMSIGRKPYSEGLGLENLGIETTRGSISVDERMRTSVENVYAAGDLTGYSMLAHTASREGEVVVNNITGTEDTMSYRAIPSVVYTNPEVAMVGLTLEAALAEGHQARELKLPMAFAGRFVAENEGGNGVCKIVVDINANRVLGMHMFGNPSSELIFGGVMAIENELTVDQLKRTVFPHPTVSEIIKETLYAE